MIVKGARNLSQFVKQVFNFRGGKALGQLGSSAIVSKRRNSWFSDR